MSDNIFVNWHEEAPVIVESSSAFCRAKDTEKRTQEDAQQHAQEAWLHATARRSDGAWLVPVCGLAWAVEQLIAAVVLELI